MSKVILAYPSYVKYEHVLKCKELSGKIFPDTELTKFDYDNEQYNPIRRGVDAVIMFAHGRVIPKEAMKRVIGLCEKYNVPLYIPCVHDLFPSETYHWTVKRVKHFQKGTTSLEQMNDTDIAGMVFTGLIPCMTLPM